jgi:hypothetical protein
MVPQRPGDAVRSKVNVVHNDGERVTASCQPSFLINGDLLAGAEFADVYGICLDMLTPTRARADIRK